ncbi:hypothetical protein Syun_019495 [Stephania yunnanensis]|uniref:Uncharacterized protein n=1 Tax=Stephania yunnanensis TaxID=152371 RepID=A0AAP0IVX1_9MAGN
MPHVSDIKLIRTDTTLDLSQKAEKVLCHCVCAFVLISPTPPLPFMFTYTITIFNHLSIIQISRMRNNLLVRELEEHGRTLIKRFKSKT